MTVDVSLEPIVKVLDVPRDAATAFDFFTSRIDLWWPKATHSMGGENCAKIVIEPGVRGRFYEVLNDGTEKLWGTIQEWEPGKRLRYTWHLSRPPELSTFVEFTFEDLGENQSRITLTHSNWDVLAEDAAEARQSYFNGWGHVFEERFAEYAKTGEAL